MESLIHGEITDVVIGGAIEVHRELGRGLLESAYAICLADELSRREYRTERELPQPVRFKGRTIDCGYRLDMVVAGKVLLELKSVENTLPVHEAQLLTYMKLARIPVGLLINFNVPRLRDGIARRVLGEFESMGSAPSASQR